MKNLRFAAILVAALSFLVFSTGCATTGASSELQLQQQYLKLCSSYVAVMKLAKFANDTNQLSQAQRDAITTADAQIFPICSGPTPADLNDAITKVTAAITTIAVNSAMGPEKTP